MHGSLGLRAFNSPDDADEDGILGEPADALPLDGLPPQITLAPDVAYLKYRAAAGIKAAAAGKTVADLGFTIDTEIGLVLADYHRHTRTVTTRDAFLEDITQLRTSLRVDDVVGLQPGEAVSQQVVGRLSATVELSWSDVFMGAIGPCPDSRQESHCSLRSRRARRSEPRSASATTSCWSSLSRGSEPMASGPSQSPDA